MKILVIFKFLGLWLYAVFRSLILCSIEASKMSTSSSRDSAIFSMLCCFMSVLSTNEEVRSIQKKEVLTDNTHLVNISNRHYN
jgi:hypothetical protein